MHRFVIPAAPEVRPGDVLALDESDARHAVQVLRLAEGDPVTLLDGAGGEIGATLIRSGRREALARVVTVRRHPRPVPVRTLAAGLTKGKAWDLTLQKATELGAHRIVPLACERSVAVVGPGEIAAKVERWKTTVAEAAKQCGAVWFPGIAPPATPEALLASPGPVPLRVLADLGPGARPVAAVLEAASTASEVVLLVGPEGDFSPAEREAFLAAGALPVHLGPLVLRAETAAAAMLAVLGAVLERAAQD